MLNFIPIQYRLAAEAALFVGIAVVGFATGDHIRGESDDAKYGKQIAGLKADYQDRIDVAQAAKDAADAKARDTEHKAQADLAAADTKHQTEISNEHAKTQAAVDDAAAGRRKLQFYAALPANPGSGGQLPGAPATAGSGDGRALVKLPDALAGSLLALTGEVDSDVVPELHLAQDTIRAYYTACGPQAGSPMATAPVGGGPPAESVALPHNPPPSSN